MRRAKAEDIQTIKRQMWPKRPWRNALEKPYWKYKYEFASGKLGSFYGVSIVETKAD